MLKRFRPGRHHKCVLTDVSRLKVYLNPSHWIAGVCNFFHNNMPNRHVSAIDCRGNALGPHPAINVIFDASGMPRSPRPRLKKRSLGGPKRNFFYSRRFASTAAHTAHEHPKLGARLAVLQLRWSHLGANFVYLGAHNGDTTSALPKTIQTYTSKTLSPVALQPSKNQRSNRPKTTTPPKRSPQWPCKHDVTNNHPKMYLQNALPSGPATQP